MSLREAVGNEAISVGLSSAGDCHAPRQVRARNDTTLSAGARRLIPLSLRGTTVPKQSLVRGNSLEFGN